MGKYYRNPPIEEAVVEFRFIPGQDWDLTIPGKLHAHHSIKNQYPGKPRTQKIMEAEIKTEGEKQPTLALRESVPRIQLVDNEGQRLISLGPNILSVNTLRPYDGWDNFRQRIRTALQAYFKVAQPVGVSKIGIRYINKIIIQERRIKMGHYFRYSPPSLPELPEALASFLSRVEYVYADKAKLLITQATIDAPEQQSAFILDLDVIWEGEEGIELKRIMKTVDDLHKREGEAFEAIITDLARELFNGD